MRINRVTFTGADNNTDVNAMVDISKQFSGIDVEWGILVSSNNNRNRYPSEDFIKSLKDKGLKLALHLCGSYSRNIMTNGNISLPYDFFQRYQINFNFTNVSHDINNYAKLCEAYPDKRFILQYNKSNSSVVNTILHTLGTDNTNVLYDASGGRGKEITSFATPFKDIYTGYSGGLSPENMDNICKLINLAKDPSEVWIDMESGVRTNDIFDLNKVVSVLKAVTDVK